jgi:hypothetical protein
VNACVAAEFSAASTNVKQAIDAELEAIFEAAQAELAMDGSSTAGLDSAAIGVPVAHEVLKPHHAGYFEARNETEGSSVIEQESYDGARLQNHFTRDVGAFLANPPVPGGTFDVSAAAEKRGSDAVGALKAVGINSHVLAQATPRLMADLCKFG